MTSEFQFCVTICRLRNLFLEPTICFEDYCKIFFTIFATASPSCLWVSYYVVLPFSILLKMGISLESSGILGKSYWFIRLIITAIRITSAFVTHHSKDLAKNRSMPFPEGLVGGILRSRTIQTVKTEIWSKIICYNLIWTIRGSYEF